jgi:hypothetical protein
MRRRPKFSRAPARRARRSSSSAATDTLRWSARPGGDCNLAIAFVRCQRDDGSLDRVQADIGKQADAPGEDDSFLRMAASAETQTGGRPPPRCLQPSAG